MPERQDRRDPTIDLEPLRVPERVDLDGDRLVWTFERIPKRPAVRVPRDLLSRFLDLRWPEDSDLVPSVVRSRWRPRSSLATLEKKEKRLPTAVVSRYESVDQERVAESRERVVAFAKRYGVLAICPPWSAHDPRLRRRSPRLGGASGLPAGYSVPSARGDGRWAPVPHGLRAA
jgi:hypothetical protein